MKLDIIKQIEIPEGVEVEIKDKEVVVKAGGKETKRKFDFANIKVEKKEKEIIVSSKKASKREGKMIGTIVAHIKNMIKGVGEGFVYKLEIASVHFPMNVKVEGDKVVIKSFLGETIDRAAEILPNVDVEIKDKEIIVSSFDKEAAGQTSANIEKAAKLKGRDRRIFQDGIFIVEKPGREI